MLTADDRFAIQELYARYNHAIDSGNSGAWAATFTNNWRSASRRHWR